MLPEGVRRLVIQLGYLERPLELRGVCKSFRASFRDLLNTLKVSRPVDDNDQSPEETMVRVMEMIVQFGCKVRLLGNAFHDLVDATNFAAVLGCVDQLAGRLLELRLTEGWRFTNDGVIEAVMPVLARSSALETLLLRCTLPEHSFVATETCSNPAATLQRLGLGLAQCKSLTELDLNYGGLDGPQVVALCTGLISLESLDLSSNKITGDDLPVVLRCLKEHKGLKELVLEGNQLGPNGLRAVFTELVLQNELPHLQYLNLYHCAKANCQMIEALRPLVEEARVKRETCTVCIWFD